MTEAESPKKSLIARLEEEGDVAADYLEGLLDIADLDGDIDIDVENERASLAIAGGALSHLVGDSGEVLDGSSIRSDSQCRIRFATDLRGHLW